MPGMDPMTKFGMYGKVTAIPGRRDLLVEQEPIPVLPADLRALVEA